MYELHPNFINPHNEAVHNIARRLSVVQASEDERNQIKPWPYRIGRPSMPAEAKTRARGAMLVFKDIVSVRVATLALQTRKTFCRNA